MLPRSSARQSEPIPQGCPSQLKKVLAELISQPGARKPESVKFFRGQMQTIITRALIDLEIKPVPSRRCFTLLSALLRCALNLHAAPRSACCTPRACACCSERAWTSQIEMQLVYAIQDPTLVPSTAS